MASPSNLTRRLIREHMLAREGVPGILPLKFQRPEDYETILAGDQEA